MSLMLIFLLSSAVFLVQHTNSAEIPDSNDYGPYVVPRDVKMARAILGYSIYDTKPITNRRAVDFESHWREIAEQQLNDPEFFGYKFGDRIRNK